MKRIIVPLVAGFGVTAATVAYGGTATGAVKVLDSRTDTMTLENGQVYNLGRHLDLTKYWIGEKVTITYQTQNGKNLASAIVSAS